MDRIRIERDNGLLFVQVWIESEQEWQTLGGACKDYDYAIDCESTLEEFVNQEIKLGIVPGWNC